MSKAKFKDKKIANTDVTDKKEKGTMGLKIAIFILTCLLVGGVLTTLSAILPRLPYSVTDAAELQHLTFGFPIKFVEQSLNEEQIQTLTEKGLNTSFILPRYDQYQTTIDWAKLLANVLILSVVAAVVLGLIIQLPRLTKKLSVFALIGLFICILSAILPAPPGTFQTIEDIQPMRFGFAIRFIEQTPPLGSASILDDEALNRQLSQSYWAPKVFFGTPEGYTIHIQGWRLLASIAVNAILAGIVYNILILLRAAKRGGKAAIKAKYIDRLYELTIRPLPSSTKQLFHITPDKEYKWQNLARPPRKTKQK